MNEWMNGWMDGWVDKWLERPTAYYTTFGFVIIPSPSPSFSRSTIIIALLHNI